MIYSHASQPGKQFARVTQLAHVFGLVETTTWAQGLGLAALWVGGSALGWRLV